MGREKDTWNFDLMKTAQARIGEVETDMMYCIHRRKVAGVVRNRMVMALRSAAEDLEKLALSND